MTTIEIHDRLPVGSDTSIRHAEIPDHVSLQTSVLTAADNCDHPNQHAVVGFKIADKMVVACRVCDMPSKSEAVQVGIRALLIYAIEHAAELRDHLLR